jgi:uncharacterized protein (TIGR02271 family)
MNQTVIGVFDTYNHAEQARQELITRGFSANDVQVQAHTADTASSMTGSTTSTTSTSSTSSTTTGHDVGFMESVRNFFGDLFGPDQEDTGHYSEAVRRGGAVVAVTVSDDSRVDSAREALASVGAIDIEKRVAEWRTSGYEGYRSDAQPYTAEEVARERERVIPVVQEELEVGKRQVNLGTVRVVARTVETPVNESVTLREEHAAIERRPVDRPASEADLAAFQDKSIEVRETAEKAVVSKTARVVEEVVVGKTATTDTQQVSDTVRNTVVDVQRDTGSTTGITGTTGTTGTTSGLTDTTGMSGTGMGTTGTTASGLADTTGMSGTMGGTGMGTTGTTASGLTGTTGMGGTGTTGMSSAYDDDYRSDYNTRYANLGGSYDDYAPAYQYGSTLASDNRYSGRSWNDIEPHVRSDWESRNPGSTWDNMKAAVRHGWERVSGQR